MQFRGASEPGNEESDEKREVMDELRDLIGQSKGDAKPLSDEDIKKRFGAETLGVIQRVQDRIDELVDTMHEFIEARENGGDMALALQKFSKLMQNTIMNYSPIEVGSMLSAGMTAIAELERRFGKPRDK